MHGLLRDPAKKERRVSELQQLYWCQSGQRSFFLLKVPFLLLKEPTKNTDSNDSKTARTCHMRVGRAGRRFVLSLGLQTSHEKGLCA